MWISAIPADNSLSPQGESVGVGAVKLPSMWEERQKNIYIQNEKGSGAVRHESRNGVGQGGWGHYERLFEDTTNSMENANQ